MADRTFQDALDNVRGVPARVFLVVCAGVVHVPIAPPQLVSRRTRHLWVREPARGPFTAFEEQVADGSPRHGEPTVFENAQKVRNILATAPPPVSSYFFRMPTKSPTQLQIRRDACCSFGVVLERSDFNAIEHSASRLYSSAPVPFEPQNQL